MDVGTKITKQQTMSLSDQDKEIGSRLEGVGEHRRIHLTSQKQRTWEHYKRCPHEQIG